MNEEQIAQKIADNRPVEKHIPAPIVDEGPQPSAFETSVELNDPAISMRLADYFDITPISRHNDTTQRQLRTVYQWAAELAQSTELDKVLPIVRQLENELGATFMPDKLARLAKFVHLKKQQTVIEAQIGGLSGNAIY